MSSFNAQPQAPARERGPLRFRHVAIRTALDLVDLSITKSNGTSTSVPGAPTTYTIIVSNAGPSDAVGASVADAFPPALSGVTWTCAASAGSSCTAAGSGDIADTVTVLAGGTLTYAATGTIDLSNLREKRLGPHHTPPRHRL